MPQTQISCPRCRQIIAANVEQLFDVTYEPAAKQRLLSGQSNHARCPHCGYDGRLATPVVYHDNTAGAGAVDRETAPDDLGGCAVGIDQTE
ncbi:MAG: hypothetical protein IPL71_06670 [Anaerolineales bacterium]|uniref:CpXC domain-containing protein n=1 Tax=Candidatus Villigracilis proximus TaxID=3140683 RepID=UPI003136F8F1|nr:hypothetical protein [Anaerolineales bacterium]